MILLFGVGLLPSLATRVRVVIARLVLIFAPWETQGYPVHVCFWRFAWYGDFFSC